MLTWDDPPETPGPEDMPDYDETDCLAEVHIGLEDSATCDIPQTVRHTTHEGPCSLGGRASWSGGGSCAGDPLPVRDLRFITED